MPNYKPSSVQNKRLVLDTHEMESEDSYEQSLRPFKLDDFIGQRDMVKNLRVYLQSALMRHTALDHVLLFAPPGLGKTTLAHIIANELQVQFHLTSGPILSKPGDLAAILTKLSKQDVLFIDEIHRLSPVVEEILYPAMEDHVLDFIIGEGPAAQNVRIPLVPFTLIGATTRSGMVSRPLRDRFGIPLAMNFYKPEELAEIVHRASKKLSLTFSDEATQLIGISSRGTPRITLRLLHRILDFATVAGIKNLDAFFVQDALNRLGIDTQGLDALDRKYIQLLYTFYKGGPVGLDTLASALSLEKDILEDVIEPYLIKEGYIKKTPRGRMLAGKSRYVLEPMGLVNPLQETPLFKKT